MAKIELYNGDCLEIMQQIPNDSIDLILCDLPYGTVQGLEIDGRKSKVPQWDIRIDTQKLFSLYEQKLRSNGVAILFSQEPYTSELRTANYPNFNFLYPMVWVKNHFANGLMSKKAPVSYFEDLSVFRKKYSSNNCGELREYFKEILKYKNLNANQIIKKLKDRKAVHCLYVTDPQFGLCSEETYNRIVELLELQKWDKYKSYDELSRLTNDSTFNYSYNGDKKVSNVLYYKKDYSNRYHPTQKPIELLEHLIKLYSNKGDIVLDNCMGGGSTGVACVNTNRSFIGIELDENYYNIAKQRIEEWQNIY